MAFLRYTRYGLIIRAGVENRAMVTALGIDVRKAFTLVFAIGGVAAALAGVLSGVYFGGSIDPERGTALLIFAFIVVVIGGLGSILGSAAAAVIVGLLQQYANYYGATHSRRRGSGHLGDAPARADAARPAERPRRQVDGGALRSVRTVLGIVVALAAFAGLALVPKWGLDTHGVFSSELNSPGTLNVLALMLVFGGVALTYDLLFGFTGLLSFGHALYFALGVYVTAIGTTKWGWSLWQALLVTAVVGLIVPLVLGSVSLRVGGIAFAMVTLAFARGGIDHRRQQPAQVDGRRGRRDRQLREAAGRVRRRDQHRQPLLAGAGLRRRRLPRRQLGRRLVAGARAPGDPGERAARRGAGAAALPLQAARLRPRVVPRHGWRRRLRAHARQRRRPA